MKRDNLARVESVVANDVRPAPSGLLPAVPSGPRLVRERVEKTPWTKAEEALLRRGRRRGLPLRKIADGLGRSKHSVAAKARRLLGPGDPNAGEHRRRRREKLRNSGALPGASASGGPARSQAHGLRWSPAERALLESEIRFRPIHEAARLLGRSAQAAEYQLYHKAGRREARMAVEVFDGSPARPAALGGGGLLLREELRERGISLREFGDRCVVEHEGKPVIGGLGAATVSDLVNHGKWPKMRGAREAVTAACRHFGIDPERALQEKEARIMLPKVHLEAECLKYHKLFKNPFDWEPRGPEQMWLPARLERIERRVAQAVKHSEFVCLVGQPGAGKSLLRRRLESFVQGDERIRMFHPRFPEMHRVHAGTIVLDILHQLSLKAPNNLVERNGALEQALAAGHAKGVRYAMIVEEAHRWNRATFSAFKNFYELGIGFEHFMGIVMFGQPQLLGKLREKDNREVIERADVIELEFPKKECAGYLAFRCDQVKADLGKLFDAKAVEAIATRAQTPQQANNIALLALRTAWLASEPAPVKAEVVERVIGKAA